MLYLLSLGRLFGEVKIGAVSWRLLATRVLAGGNSSMGGWCGVIGRGLLNAGYWSGLLWCCYFITQKVIVPEAFPWRFICLEPCGC